MLLSVILIACSLLPISVIAKTKTCPGIPKLQIRCGKTFGKWPWSTWKRKCASCKGTFCKTCAPKTDPCLGWFSKRVCLECLQMQEIDVETADREPLLGGTRKRSRSRNQVLERLPNTQAGVPVLAKTEPKKTKHTAPKRLATHKNAKQSKTKQNVQQKQRNLEAPGPISIAKSVKRSQQTASPVGRQKPVSNRPGSHRQPVSPVASRQPVRPVAPQPAAVGRVEQKSNETAPQKKQDLRIETGEVYVAQFLKAGIWEDTVWAKIPKSLQNNDKLLTQFTVLALKDFCGEYGIQESQVQACPPGYQANQPDGYLELDFNGFWCADD